MGLPSFYLDENCVELVQRLEANQRNFARFSADDIAPAHSNSEDFCVETCMYSDYVFM